MSIGIIVLGIDMLFSLLTVVFYVTSSIGDKFISAKLKFNSHEFSFLVSAATAFFLALLLPFLGWKFIFSPFGAFLLLLLVGLKIGEFYTSAYLLKTVSAYELKAWLSLNVVFSLIVNILRGTNTLLWEFVPCIAALFAGIYLIASPNVGKSGVKAIFCSILYIASKFFYGFCLNALPQGTSSVSVLFLVMVGVALIQLPYLHFKRFFRTKGLTVGALTRLPNAAGLWTEAIAAGQNILLYSLVQPMQLAVLLLTALAGGEKLGRQKVGGGILVLVAVIVLTVLIYIFGRSV